MRTRDIIHELEGVGYFLNAHPDNQEGSEAADQLARLHKALRAIRERKREEEQFPNAPAGMIVGVSEVRALGRLWTVKGGDIADGSILLQPRSTSR